MSITAIKSRLASMQKAITGITNAYAQSPSNINTSDMPLFVNITGRGQPDYAALGDAHNLMTRAIGMRLYVMPVASGIPGEGEEETETLIESVYAYFSARPSLGNLDNIQMALIAGDSGVVQFGYEAGSTPYIGVEFTLQIKEYKTFTYAPGE